MGFLLPDAGSMMTIPPPSKASSVQFKITSSRSVEPICRSFRNCTSVAFETVPMLSVFVPSTRNDLPHPLRQKPSLDSMKCNIKTFLFPKL